MRTKERSGCCTARWCERGGVEDRDEGAVVAEPTWSIYFIRCAGGEIYTGIATDVARRFAEHAADGRRTARYLRGRGPLKLVASAAVGSRSDALRLEAAVKGLSRRRKLAMLADDEALQGVLQSLR